jgi:hypothetical protein
MDRPTNRRRDTIRPPTWAQIEAALYNGRLVPWANAIPGFHAMTPGEQACRAFVEFFPRYLPRTQAEADAIDGLYPDAINALVFHLLEHLRLRQSLNKPCAICKLLVGLKVARDGVGAIRVYQTDVNADIRISPNDRPIAWHCAACSSPAALQRLKEIILSGDHVAESKEARHG